MTELKVDSAEALWKVDGICNQITNLYKEDGIHLPLLVVYVWDIVRDFWNDSDMKMTASKVDVWKRMWADAGIQGFTLEYGNEHLYEHLRDWLMETGLMIDTTEEEEEEEEVNA